MVPEGDCERGLIGVDDCWAGNDWTRAAMLERCPLLWGIECAAVMTAHRWSPYAETVEI